MVDFCKSYLIVNKEAFCDPRLELVINDARFGFDLRHFYDSSYITVAIFSYYKFSGGHVCRAELESREEQYDVIVGDLADPIEGGPCYKLYTKSFYEYTVKPRLKQDGIFITQVSKRDENEFSFLNVKWERDEFKLLKSMQAGPAGIFSHTEVFSCIYNTLKQVFKCEQNLRLFLLLVLS